MFGWDSRFLCQIPRFLPQYSWIPTLILPSSRSHLVFLYSSMKYTAANCWRCSRCAFDTKSTAVHIYRTHEGDISLPVRYYLTRVRDPMKKLDTVNVKCGWSVQGIIVLSPTEPCFSGFETVQRAPPQPVAQCSNRGMPSNLLQWWAKLQLPSYSDT